MADNARSHSTQVPTTNLYLDMDGVLMDYEGAIVAHGVPRYRDGAHWISRPRAEWPQEMIDADRAYVACMAKETFWKGIEPMTDALDLWHFASSFSPNVLTATPLERPGDTTISSIRDRIAQDKRESIWQHFDPKFPADRIITCLRHEKAKYARPGAVLVDDTPGNCSEWEARGGTAILHKDARSTIDALKRLGFLRDYTSAERKAMPVHTGCMLYFPDALAAVARVSKKGNDKHNPGEPLHWARSKSTDQSDCVARHSLTPDRIDPESGETERAHQAWRVLADLQLAEERRLFEAGIRPFSGVLPT